MSKIKQAKIIAKQVRFELENAKNKTLEDVRKSWLELKTSETMLSSAKVSLEAKKLIFTGVEQEAKVGIKSYIDILKSQEDLHDAELEEIKAQNQFVLSALKLKANIGELSLKDLDIQ